MTTSLTRREETALAPGTPAEMSIEELVARTRKVQEAMKAVMHEGEHYGVIPGTGSKPTLLKPGAEKLLNLFMLDPQYEIHREREGDHLSIESKCILFHIATGTRVGSGMGSCSTRESKYAYRQGKRACPKCGAEAINRSKYPPKGKPKGTPEGWYCYSKAGGCGAEFDADDATITSQAIGRIDNPDKADQYNTVLKMANKRSLVAAVLNVTGASDIFTQDLEDLPDVPLGSRPPADAPKPPIAGGNAGGLDALTARLSGERPTPTPTPEPDPDPVPEPAAPSETEIALKRSWILARRDKLNLNPAVWARLLKTHAGVEDLGQASLDGLDQLSDALGGLGKKA